MGKIIIVGSESVYGMERSYKIALESLGYEVEIIDFNKLCNNLIGISILSRIGYQVNVIPSINRANHLISKKIFTEKPTAIIVFTNVKIYPGTIEYFKLFCNNVFFYWPDSIVNINSDIFFNIKHYNAVFTHSLENVRIFSDYGVKSKLIPFAGDTLNIDPSIRKNIREAEYDFSFIGSYRPERLNILIGLINEFCDRKFMIVGPGWSKKQFKKSKNLFILNDMVDLNRFLDFTTRSRISLNIIDYLNYPSSNLRFYEIGLSSIPQITSFIPEYVSKFIHNKHVYYYKELEDLIETSKFIFNNYNEALECAKKFKEMILIDENYIVRSKELIENFA